MIQESRIQTLNDKPIQHGQFVLYWMQASARTRLNHALERAIEHANRLRQPLEVVFGLNPAYPEANERSYTFLLEGLRDVQQGLERRGIPFAVRLGHTPDVVLESAREASLVVTDRAYLRHQRAWREQVASGLPCTLEQVESDVVVPVQTASSKEEVGARTLRPKIHRLLPEYRVGLDEQRLEVQAKSRFEDALDLSDIRAVLERFRPDASVPASPLYRGGETEARKQLEKFVQEGLAKYVEGRGGPMSSVSNLSPYLHYGHVSPLEMVLKLHGEAAQEGQTEAVDAFLEELIVRRELSMNFCFYNAGYDDYTRAVPGWAQATLEKHRPDPRPHRYSLEQLERAETHDPYWNAAHLEMVRTGKMANYMRMYWSKKVLEWTETPEAAFELLLYLNNRFELDGRNPNSYAGIAWCFGRHDRPWMERPIFGIVRYLAASGLDRKFDMPRYVKYVQGL